MATAPTRPGDEIARLGREIYERDIRRQVEADHDGDYVAIDVDSGEWAVAVPRPPRWIVFGSNVPPRSTC